jgi:glutamate synthase (NADPH/NADH) large chain
MMRVCHLDTCPVGIATQNPVLRERFSGKPEFVVTFFEYIAEEVRELLAALGYRTLDEAIGRAEMLDVEAAVQHWKASGLDLAPILHVPAVPDTMDRRHTTSQDHGLDKALDNELIELCAPALESGEPVRAQLAIRNVNRTVGTMLGSEVTSRYGGEGLPDETIDLTFVGSAGQSFGAFLPSGITLRLEGDANDYVGKGLSGGRIVIRPHRDATFVPEDNIIAGNVIAYGATGGEFFLRGRVGERFCVRNSGATAVVEGVGDHALEYMTGGLALIIGSTGRNIGAGMSGGVGYVLDLNPGLVNPDMVDLDPLSTDDFAVVERLLRRHAEETGSGRAAELLAEWPASAARFTAIMPKDYKRVLRLRAEAEEKGMDPIEAVMGGVNG